ncbi:hypothetical protein MILUP08_42254 [Micromonospora lupini str. Lupac 08]|uniref:Uncharacterized protein n=1 Tax=Micromonospora lupini str. Lupac 08 TaxID=1150864 RepID=I0L0I6_9ACTN|nr:hypothetical protein MILUP08_42254 [Micromonospora lupini str. Lupac 08]
MSLFTACYLIQTDPCRPRRDRGEHTIPGPTATWGRIRYVLRRSPMPRGHLSGPVSEPEPGRRR